MKKKRLMISAKESRDGAVPEEGMYLHAKGRRNSFRRQENPGNLITACITAHKAEMPSQTDK